MKQHVAMKQHVIISCAFALIAMAVSGCTSMGSASSALSAFEQLGGTGNLTKVASSFLGSTLKDPQLSGLTAGKSIDSAATTGKLTNQLCSLLGGGCQAPLTDSQVNAAASKVSPDQSKAISSNFESALKSVVSDPAVQKLVTSTVGSKLSGIVGALL
jgi:hypothetical protein